jgi:UDP-N-acetylmuramyl pentapeptide phosphotransferase/UDP-N-acetylglucosamine-1-phosphate transferase
LKRPTIFWIFVLFLFALVIATGLALRPVQYHPIIVFSITKYEQVTFLQYGKPTRVQCEANVDRMVKAMQQGCEKCLILEHRCSEKLNPLQRKILHGQPVDAPVLRVSGGAIAFTGAGADLALEACRESERKGARLLSGGARCAPAAMENLALSLAKVNGNANATPAPSFNVLLGITALSSLIACLVCYLIIVSERLHGRYSNDSTQSGPQKFHATPTPRVGGVALAVALASSLTVMHLLAWLKPTAMEGITLLALSAVPAFAAGLGEDLTKKVGVLARLILTVSAAIAASLLVGATLDRLDVPGFDTLLQWPIFAVVFTAIAVGGMANAINIIDGYNGLAGGYALLVLGAMAFVAVQVGDHVVLAGSLTMAGAVFGLLVWNYPKGKIFLGDGGAYLLGFWLGELSILLVARNPEVSPWFPMALLIYPVFETCFSVYRRKYIRGSSPGRPDALHLHQLIYLRLSRISVGSRDPREITRRNSSVARYIWTGTAVFILAALPVWRNTPVLMGITAVFCAAYLWLYIRLIRWRAPSWLITSTEPHVGMRAREGV